MSLGRSPEHLEVLVVIANERLELFELTQIGDPVTTDMITDQLGHGRVGMRNPTARSHTIGLVIELLRPEFIEVTEHPLLQQPGVQRGNTINGIAADNREVGHANHLYRALFDYRHALLPIDIARPAHRYVMNEARIHIVNNLHRPREQFLEQVHRPLFESLRQQGMVGIGHGVLGDFPGFIPGKALLIHENAHQLGNRNGGMRVVHLEDVLTGKV